MRRRIPDEMAARVRGLTPARQEQAVAYVRSLEEERSPAGLLRLAGSIASTDLAEIAAAIEAGCERVDDIAHW
jgi:hypothetical protein